jgi:squalene cyclase
VNATTTLTRNAKLYSEPVTRLQGDAWAAWNASYHAEDRDAYRAVSRALYEQDVHERIERLFALSDEQNRHLDMVLTTKGNQKP